MDKREALAAMQGNEDGLGKGLTSYPAHEDRKERDTHEACLELEREGKVTRYRDDISKVDGQPDTPYVIWIPVDPSAVKPPQPDDEEERP